MKTVIFPRKPLLSAVVCAVALTCTYAATAAERDRTGAIIKVRPDMDGSALSGKDIGLKTVIGNLLAVDVPSTVAGSFAEVHGVVRFIADGQSSVGARPDVTSIIERYAGADAIIGIIDNTVSAGPLGLDTFQKIEQFGNIGFISYRSDDPSSTVIMHNLRGGESDLMQSLSYMKTYADAVGRRLVIHMSLDGHASSNTLFMQACHHIAEQGNVSMLGSGASSGIPFGSSQIAFAMFHSESGRLTDRTPFWEASEAEGMSVQLLGSDGLTCEVDFKGDRTQDLRNSSVDIVMAMVLDSEGRMHYYHLKGDNMDLRIVNTPMGIPVLSSSKGDLLPFHGRSILRTRHDSETVAIDLTRENGNRILWAESGSKMTATATAHGHLELQITGSIGQGKLVLTDHHGKVVYQCAMHQDASSLYTRIDLTSRSESLYRLNIETVSGCRDIVLRM